MVIAPTRRFTTRRYAVRAKQSAGVALGGGIDDLNPYPMSRYKGQLRASRTEREFPHHVEIIVPPGGLGRRLDDMYNFHIQHYIKPQRGHGTHTADGSVIRWCFADANLAEEFASKFGT
jgi:hypothetical protein